MRVKVGNEWFEATVDTPIMVELTEADKQNITNMHPDATMYAMFDDSSSLTKEQKLEWMDGKAKQ